MISNVHTHTVFCDGQNTPMELAAAAAAKGFEALGFSSHGPELSEPGFGLQQPEAYRAAVAEAAEAYRGRLHILCGLEMDFYSAERYDWCDYIVGSVHAFPPKNGRYYSVDASPEKGRQALEEGYGGDWKAMVRDFYALTVENVATYKPEVVGHFDLIKRFNNQNELFPADSAGYRALALEAMDEVLKLCGSYGGIVELNTAKWGKSLDEPYPAPFLLRHMASKNARVIITTDCHAADSLDYRFEDAKMLLKDAGFTSMAQLTADGFVDTSIL